MKTAEQCMEPIAVFFCKDFPEVVRKARCKEPHFLETSHSFLNGTLHLSGNEAITVIPKESLHIIDAMTANGYTVTAYVRLSDFNTFIPFDDEFEASTANAVNKKILGEAFPEAKPN
jgi:hypothetical protein